ncbi:MAG: UxaA family hydrolase [Promethearchaeota archaeon]
MDEKDNCATSLAELEEHEEVELEGKKIVLNQKIPFGHKFAIKPIKKGDLLYKYGEIIGIATQDIQEGDWIHTHNIKSHYLEKVAKEG